jgi:polypeptide N-acetylgalactosaminyltransferase
MGAFDYGLSFTWKNLTDRENMRRNFDNSMPFRTPAIAGGLFTIDRKFFYDLGSYDQGLLIKIWRCSHLQQPFKYFI